MDKLRTADECISLLEHIDLELASRKECGETTGVIVIVDSRRIFGASVGDSAAWLFASDGATELTYGQARKPLLGSGEISSPRGFSCPIEEGTIVVASDGLWKYTTHEAITSRVRSRGDSDLALRLAELTRLKSGDFPDDVAVITCRIDLSATRFRIGEIVRVLQVPPSVEREMPSETVALFRKCVGQVLRIDDIDEHGHLELNVTSDGQQVRTTANIRFGLNPNS